MSTNMVAIIGYPQEKAAEREFGPANTQQAVRKRLQPWRLKKGARYAGSDVSSGPKFWQKETK